MRIRRQENSEVWTDGVRFINLINCCL